MLVIIIMILMR